MTTRLRPFRTHSTFVALSLGLLALASTACGSDDESSTDSSAPPVVTESTAASTTTPTTAAPTTVPPTSAATTTVAPSGPLTEAEATAMAETIINSWNTDDLSPILQLMKPDDVWIAITGKAFNRNTVAGWLNPILAAIGDTEHTGDPVAVPDGFSFPLLDVMSNGPFWLIITRSPEGVLTIEESPTAP